MTGAEANPYAPPKAAVADIAPAVAAAEPIFFPVSRTKLIVLLILTLTMYQLVWFYKNWALVRRRGESVWPLPRTLFGVLFCYSLFERVRVRGAPLGVRLDAGLLAAGFILFSVVGNLIDRFAGIADSVAASGIGALLLYVAVFFLVPVQSAINTINRAEVPDHDPNDRFTALNWVWIVLGGLFIGLVALGLSLPEPQ